MTLTTWRLIITIIAVCTHTHSHPCDLKQSVLDEETHHLVRVDIGGRASVLKVPLASQLHGKRNTDGGTTVSNTETEGIDVAGLVLASQTFFIPGAILGNVLSMALGQTLNGLLNGLHATITTHGLGGVVGVGTSAIPVTLDGLGSKGRYDAKLFTQTVQQPTGNHHLIPSLQGTGGTNLELPLPGHHLSIDARNNETSLDASIHVGFRQVAAVHRLGTDTAVEGALGGGESTCRPAIHVAMLTQHGVFLLKAKQASFLLDLVVDDGLEVGTRVGGMGFAIGVEDIAHDEDVVTATNGVRTHIHGSQDAIRVLAFGLAGGGAIKGPRREVLGVEGGDGLLDDLGLGAHLVEDGALDGLAFLAIVPDVLCLLGEGSDTEDSDTTL